MRNGIAKAWGHRLQMRWSKDGLLRGFGALGLGELCVRVSRIVTTIVLARSLGATELGIAATALASFELVRVLANNGLGQMVVRAPEERLAAVCNTAHRLAWAACILMAAIQITVGIVAAQISGRPELLGMAACLAGVFAFMPAGMVNSWLLQRQFRMPALACINTVQVGTDNLLTAALAVLGFGAWAIVLPKLLTAPIWLIGVRRAVVWQREPHAGAVPMREVLGYAAPILGSEVLAALRFNLDKVLVGGILGLEALGIYYFAFSAGYGLSMVLTSALAAASFPHLADHRLSPSELLERFDKALLGLALPISALIGLQSLAVFVYVPVLFGEKWAAMTTIVAVLCLSAATKSWQDLGIQLLRAAGLTGYELGAAALFTVVLLGSLSAGLPFGLLAGVVSMSISAIVLQLVFAAWARGLVARRYGLPAGPFSSGHGAAAPGAA